MYLGLPCYGYALYCHFFYLAILETCPFCTKKQTLFYIHATTKSKMQIRSNKHETGLTSWLSFVVSTVSLSLSLWYPGSGVVLDCIDS